jgi:hypothetical protein
MHSQACILSLPSYPLPQWFACVLKHASCHSCPILSCDGLHVFSSMHPVAPVLSSPAMICMHPQACIPSLPSYEILSCACVLKHASHRSRPILSYDDSHVPSSMHPVAPVPFSPDISCDFHMCPFRHASCHPLSYPLLQSYLSHAPSSRYPGPLFFINRPAALL